MEKKVTLPCVAFFLASVLSHVPATGTESTPVSDIERVNLTSAGAEFSESFSLGHPSISADGRYVVFTSNNALVPGDTNGMTDVYMRDRVSGTTQLVSLTSTGGIALSGGSYNARISADGSAVAFVSSAIDLVPGDTNGVRDVFVRDLVAGTTTRVSVVTGGGEGNGNSGDPNIAARDISLSDDGRYVAFLSSATNLVAGDSNGRDDIFRHDRVGGTTIRVSIDTGGAETDGHCLHPAISGDGSKVAFAATATNFAGSPGGFIQVWLRNITTSTTELISKDNGGTAGNAGSFNPDLSYDGRYVTYDSRATNLVSPAAGADNIYVRDRTANTTSLVSITTTGVAGGNAQLPVITADGRYIAFASFSNLLVLGDTNTQFDVFVRDLQTGSTGIVSRTSTFLQGNGASNRPAIADGTLEVVFESYANNLVPGDSNGMEDIFVAAPAFPSTILINEVDAFTANGQTFIELHDGGAGNTDLTGLVVVLYDGATDTSYGAFDLDGYSTGADGYFVIGTAAVPGVDLVAAGGFLQGGVDAVALYYDNATSFPNGSAVTVNRLLDAVVHENNQSNDSGLLPLLQNTSQPQADEAANGRAATESVQRLPDGAGLPGVTGVFKAYTPSPGAANGVPAALDLDELSDSGRSDSDDVTNDTTPTITGTAPVGSTVVLSGSLTGVVGSDTADTAGIWTITPTVALGEGTHLFTATADGGPSSAALSVVIDTTAPPAPAGLTLASSSDSGVSNSDRITNVITPTIEGTAENGSLVTLFNTDAIPVGSIATTGNWSLVADETSDGNHQFTATAEDLAGNESIGSAALSVTIDTAPPAVVVARQAGQATPASGAPVVFTAVFDEAVNGLVVGDFTVTDSAGAGDLSLGGGPAGYTFTIGSVTGEGTISVSLAGGVAGDTAGNASEASTGTNNTVEIDLHGSTTGTSTPVILSGGAGTSGGYLGIGDTDVFAFTLTEAKQVFISTGHGVDTYGSLRNAAGDLLNDPVADDNAGTGNNFRIGRALAPGTYYVEVTGTGSAPTGAYQIDIDATLDPVYLPDALAGRTLATAVGNNRYGAGQLALFTTRRAAPVSAVFAAGNDGDLDDTYLLSGGRGNALFAVTYTHAVNGNVTAAMQAGTYSTGIVGPASSYLINVQVVPNKKKLILKKRVKKRRVTIYLKKTFTLPLIVRSATDPLASDTVTIQVKTR